MRMVFPLSLRTLALFLAVGKVYTATAVVDDLKVSRFRSAEELSCTDLSKKLDKTIPQISLTDDEDRVMSACGSGCKDMPTFLNTDSGKNFFSQISNLPTQVTISCPDSKDQIVDEFASKCLKDGVTDTLNGLNRILKEVLPGKRVRQLLITLADVRSTPELETNAPAFWTQEDHHAGIKTFEMKNLTVELSRGSSKVSVSPTAVPSAIDWREATKVTYDESSSSLGNTPLTVSNAGFDVSIGIVLIKKGNQSLCYRPTAADLADLRSRVIELIKDSDQRRENLGYTLDQLVNLQNQAASTQTSQPRAASRPSEGRISRDQGSRNGLAGARTERGPQREAAPVP